MTHAEMVREFHEAFGLPMRTRPDLEDARIQLRLDLIEEEYGELVSALEFADIIETADALADLLYVVYGAALEFGIPIDAVFESVHESNMRKLGADGKPIRRDDGKVLKPAGWQPPDIRAALGSSA